MGWCCLSGVVRVFAFVRLGDRLQTRVVLSAQHEEGGEAERHGSRSIGQVRGDASTRRDALREGACVGERGAGRHGGARWRCMGRDALREGACVKERGAAVAAARRCTAEVHGWHMPWRAVGRLWEEAGGGPEKAPGKTRQNCTSLSLRRRQTRCRAEFARRFQKAHVVRG